MKTTFQKSRLFQWAGTILFQFFFWLAINLIYAVIFLFGAIEPPTPDIAVDYGRFFRNLGEALPWIMLGSLLYSLFIGTTDFLESLRRRSKHTFAFQIVQKFLIYLAGLFTGCLIPILIWMAINRSAMVYNLIFFSPRMFSIIFFSMIALMVLSYVQQLSKNIGRENMLRILLGQYYHPRTENWIFLFLDLKDSTLIAEQTGHRRFAVLIQDLFFILNRLAEKTDAEIYKYVGDEAILCWKNNHDGQCLNILDLFFSFQEELRRKKEYFQNKYGIRPGFKAGVHLGEVTVAEVGDIKREIAFYGDVVNTAARIEAACNRLGSSLLISGDVYRALSRFPVFLSEYDAKIFPDTELKGKQLPLTLYGISRKSNDTE